MVNDFGSLKGLLIDKIKKNGPISFKDFMALCLYEENLGYYSQDEIRIGKHGDFVTAPHTSKLFGYLLAVQIQQFFEILENQGQELSIAEFGAGTGVLAGDILEYFKRFSNGQLERLRYVMVEPLSKRREVLKKSLSGFKDNIKIVDCLSETGRFRGVVIANELFDAFPVHLIEKKEDEFFEIFVDVSSDEERLVEKAFKISDEALKDYVNTYLSHLPNGYRTEVNLEMKKWIDNLSSSMEKGFCLIIDYGYSREDYYADFRNRGTLLGYSRQRVTEDFFEYPGLIDMTAHVNFSDARLWFEQAGFVAEGFCPQWAFLGGLDMEQTMEKAFGRLEPFSPVLASVKSLIFPQGMGETHKVFVASKGVDKGVDLKGFKMKNDIVRLT